ncbi:hypothetical protein [Pelomonas sp. SE-A7]|uniref:hypothetical protein n=1 Tax=Pelomonas sp. SE-A7 TaxID=3054953 RepID=UPI00259CF8C0|nr:hypothetical protein [Pelomonas sp. SE-A7]MDM4765171.1 hypothetical protein [Pelomonas sp. SE-A7]
MIDTQAQTAANPFAMLLDLERVVREVECSERLNRLRRRVFRPLDKPAIPHADSAQFDSMLDAADGEGY